MQAIADELPVAPDQMVVFDSSGVLMATSPELGAAMLKVEGDPATNPDMMPVELDDQPRADEPLVIPAEGEMPLDGIVAPPDSQAQNAFWGTPCNDQSAGCMRDDLPHSFGADPAFEGSGPYRRFWARTGISGFIGDIQLPSRQSDGINLRQNPQGRYLDLVFFYVGRRTNSALSANDAGVMYQPVNDNWAPLLVVAKAGAGQVQYLGNGSKARFKPAQRLQIAYSVGDNQLSLNSKWPAPSRPKDDGCPGLEGNDWERLLGQRPGGAGEKGKQHWPSRAEPQFLG
jgi:hypothetical protein